MINFYNKFMDIITNKELYTLVLNKVLSIFLIIIVAILANIICLKISDYIIKTSIKANDKFNIDTNIKRSNTLYKLVRSIIRYTIYFIAFIQILSVLGVNTTGILASAGIVSVAVGFGAQNLVKDIITGFFIIVEGQFAVGEYVRIHNLTAFIAEGTVMSLGIRSTKIRSDGGEVYFIPNSSINQVINYSRNFSQIKTTFSISIKDAFENLEKEINDVLDIINNKTEYKNSLYSGEQLILKYIDSIESGAATVTIVGKVKLGEKTVIENNLKKDFYNTFRERLLSKES